ncbi:hypothetical protein T11_17638, partial [Trichinella zimbabwensis]
LMIIKGRIKSVILCYEKSSKAATMKKLLLQKMFTVCKCRLLDRQLTTLQVARNMSHLMYYRSSMVLDK